MGKVLLLVACLVLAAGSVSTARQAHAVFPGANGRVAFDSYRDGHWGVYAMNADGSGQILLRSDVRDDQWPAWSPDGRKLAFIERASGDAKDQGIYVMNANGAEPRRLTSRCAQSFDWSPDGTRIAFDGCVDDFNVYVVDVADARLNVVANSDHVWADPAWSPDGREIAFASADGIQVVTASGSGRTSLTKDRLDARPAWSPTGHRIAFAARTGGSSAIYVMNADGSGVRRLPGAGALLFAWSPDGSRIAFDTCCSGQNEIFVVNIDGSGLTRLVRGGDPAWSPDGKKIAFSTGGGISTIGADGTGLTALTDPGANDGDARWQTLPSADLGLHVAAKKSGQRVVYTITVRDHGFSNAMNVTVHDRLPAGTGFVSIRASHGNCRRSRSGSIGIVTCSPGLQLVGSNWSARLVVETGRTKGTIRNLVHVTSSTLDPNSGNNAATTATRVG